MKINVSSTNKREFQMKENTYWNNYYQNLSSTNLEIPSQFAAFVASDLIKKNTTVLDIGCGNGRDSLFFARHGIKTIGIDGSQEAINWCRKNSEGLNAHFVCEDINSNNLKVGINNFLKKSDDILLYSRFFLHAIDLDAENSLLEFAQEICLPGQIFALEFRTLRDRENRKETKSHYRRFINSFEFLENAMNHEFKLIYFAEGFGYAKYKSDDAHVARIVLTKD